MYYAVIQQFRKTLNNLDNLLEKAKLHAEARKFDPNAFLEMRLAPDMLNFTKQIQIATDSAKFAAAGLAAKEAPRYEDNEKTFADLRERIRKTAAYLESFHETDFNRVPERVKLTYPQGKAMAPQDFLASRAVPNFFFHITTAYALLRNAGVDIGKTDYLGDLKMFDA